MFLKQMDSRNASLSLIIGHPILCMSCRRDYNISCLFLPKKPIPNHLMHQSCSQKIAVMPSFYWRQFNKVKADNILFLEDFPKEFKHKIPLQASWLWSSSSCHYARVKCVYVKGYVNIV